jgi:hypothetical protein
MMPACPATCLRLGRNYKKVRSPGAIKVASNPMLLIMLVARCHLKQSYDHLLPCSCQVCTTTESEFLPLWFSRGSHPSLLLTSSEPHLARAFRNKVNSTRLCACSTRPKTNLLRQHNYSRKRRLEMSSVTHRDRT